MGTVRAGFQRRLRNLMNRPLILEFPERYKCAPCHRGTQKSNYVMLYYLGSGGPIRAGQLRKVYTLLHWVQYLFNQVNFNFELF